MPETPYPSQELMPPFNVFSISKNQGQAFYYESTIAAPTSGSDVIAIKNISETKTMYIDSIEMSSKAIATWSAWLASTTDLITGTSITGVNLNKGSSNTDSASALGDDNIVYAYPDSRVFFGRSQANEWLYRPVGGLWVLPIDKTFVIRFAQGTSTDLYVGVTAVFD